MINFDPTARPTIQQIIQHPFFKKPTEALDYIRSTYELNKTNAEFVKALEVQTAHLFDSDWKLSLSAKVQQKLQKGTLTPYKGDSVLHLAKAIRDKVIIKYDKFAWIEIKDVIIQSTHRSSMFTMAICLKLNRLSSEFALKDTMNTGFIDSLV